MMPPPVLLNRMFPQPPENTEARDRANPSSNATPRAVRKKPRVSMRPGLQHTSDDLRSLISSCTIDDEVGATIPADMAAVLRKMIA
jgi:hypothetical protein